ncbi:hypothetical protein ACWDA3_46465 [Nonomuraea rubra]
MHAFDILGDPVRRRVLELLADGEQTSGASTEIIPAEFAISQPARGRRARHLAAGEPVRAAGSGTDGQDRCTTEGDMQ